MRLAGRFARRVRAFAKANGIPVIDCERGERKHLIAEEYLATHDVGRGVFMILVARAVSPTWRVTRSKSGVLVNLEKKPAFVNHFSFHIMDPDWGHLVIKISSHPPFGTQIICNGHNYVARRADKAGISYRKEGNCFTIVEEPARLARVAEALSHPAAVGRLRRVCDRWIYSAVLCFALDLAEQQAAGARYQYSIYQVEYSRNLLFSDGAVMDQVFDRVVDRTRARLDVPRIKTLFGAKRRPHRDRKKPATIAAVVETQSYDLTWFKVTFGCLGLKAYTKGERVLRIEATCHNAAGAGLRADPREAARDRRPARGHGPTILQHPRRGQRRVPLRRHLGPTTPPRPARPHPRRGYHPRLAPHPRRARRRHRLIPGAEGVHRRRPGRQTARHHRTDRLRLQRTPGRLRHPLCQPLYAGKSSLGVSSSFSAELVVGTGSSQHGQWPP